MKAGIPVFVGYFSASLAFGLLAVSSGLLPWEAVLFSAVSCTGAGQFMSINLMSQHVPAAAAVFSVFLLNFRYLLMSMSLSIRIDFKRKMDRFVNAAWVTDEVFSVISTRSGKVPVSFVYGLQLVSAAGWIGGTAAGALGSSFLPHSVQEAAGIALYALFAALLVPEVKKNTANLLIAGLAALLNCLFSLGLHWPAGWSFVAAMLTAAAAGMLILPKENKEAIA